MQRVAAFGSQRQTDQPAAMGGHEVDGLGRDALGGHGEVALIFAVLIVHHHQDAPGAHLLDSLGNGGKWHYFLRITVAASALRRPVQSPSRLSSSAEIAGKRSGLRIKLRTPSVPKF